jgi:hypothetical protein
MATEKMWTVYTQVCGVDDLVGVQQWVEERIDGMRRQRNFFL